MNRLTHLFTVVMILTLVTSASALDQTGRFSPGKRLGWRPRPNRD